MRVQFQGSPPRMRGKVIVDLVLTERHRITPACAGKRESQNRPCPRCRDHSRTCGEKALSTFSSRKNSGSPPHMRGKVCVGMVDAPLLGITPACAGKRVNGRKPAYNMRDHPRMCGEKSPSCTAIGSASRITPACAGKRKSCAEAKINAWDHPRMCGEKLILSTLRFYV